jgi:drug/metabolite transporter (DMT)-like permease
MAKGNFKEDIKSFNIYNVLRAGISFLSMTWFAAGLAGTPLNKAMSLTFITPVFMSLIGIIWLKEKSTIEKWTAIFIGLLGGIIIENPFGGFNYSSLYIIGACVLWAITGMVMKILSQRQDPITITFYMSLLTVPISLPYFIYDPYLPNPKECIIMLMLGFFYNLAQITATKAYQLTQLTVVAPFDFLRMILGIILGYMFFDEVVSDNTIFGSILVILGTTLVAGKEIHKLSTRSKS